MSVLTKSFLNLQVDVVSGVSVCLLGAPHGVHVLVVICPVVVRAGGPVVAVREAVPVPAPEKWTTVMKRMNGETTRTIYILFVQLPSLPVSLTCIRSCLCPRPCSCRPCSWWRRACRGTWTSPTAACSSLRPTSAWPTPGTADRRPSDFVSKPSDLKIPCQ